MDSPQYKKEKANIYNWILLSFKPYYKWIVLNTEDKLNDLVKDFGF